MPRNEILQNDLPDTALPHVLQVHNFYRQAGGEDAVLANEEKLLTRRGHQVFQYSLHNDTIPAMAQFQVAAQTLWNANAYRAVRQRIQKHGIAIVHVHNTFPLISPSVYYAASAEKVPVVQTLHNYRLLCPAATFYRDGSPCEDCLGKQFPWPAIVHRCYRKSIPASGMASLMLAAHRSAHTYSSKVNAYITFNRFSRDKFIAGGIPAERIHIKPNFVPDDPGIGSGQGGYALFAGRLTAEKGIGTLLKAWALLGAPVNLKIAGDGPLRAAVQSFAARNPRVEYLGQCSRPHVNELMRNAAMLVLPSEWYEGSPMSLIEAMACGTPVLASKIGGLPETVVAGENGLLFPSADVKALAAAVDQSFAEPDQLSRMRYSTRQYYETNFAPSANYRQLLAIYKSVMAPA